MCARWPWYDGPFRVLSLVDNRAFTRLMDRVLEKDPTQGDILALLGDFKAHLDARGREVRGVTTDGSNLGPAPLAESFPDVPHQACRFRALKEITKAVRSVYSVRTAEHIRQRIAPDMQREQRSGDRLWTAKTLHRARAGP